MGRPQGTFQKITEQQFQLAVERYKAGDSIRKCVENLPVTHQSFRVLMVRRNIQLRPNSYRPKSGRWLNRNGYYVVWHNNKKRLEHRVIVERILGRPLLDKEIVHHINGNKTDNSPENLELTNHSDHSTEHATARWANPAWKEKTLSDWKARGLKPPLHQKASTK